MRYSMILLLALSFFARQPLNAQEMTADYKKKTILKLNQLMNDFYVFPEVAQKTSEYLKSQFEEGAFDEFEDHETFAQALTTAVQHINHDKHMRIRRRPAFKEAEDSPKRRLEEQLMYLNQRRQFHAGFNKAEILEGNIGYLDLRGFAGVESGKLAADAYMHLLSGSDAIIIDLRRNGGGDPRMVQYLCSFFFSDKVHLNSLYFRPQNSTEEFWTLDEVGGQKMPDIPLFVLTSNRTFSGAEEFAYNMQTRKRATLIGQTSGGGANPGDTRIINDSLQVFIPTGRAINPVTNTNWEGVGVVPEIQVNESESLSKAIVMAREAATEYRQQKMLEYETLMGDLHKALERNHGNEVQTHLRSCVDAGLLGEGAINQMGYEYLMDHKKPKVAQVIFKANTYLFPESANVYDSYAESLLLDGQKELAITNYRIAVDKARKSNAANLELFEENLNKAVKQKP